MRNSLFWKRKNTIDVSVLSLLKALLTLIFRNWKM